MADGRGRSRGVAACRRALRGGPRLRQLPACPTAGPRSDARSSRTARMTAAASATSCRPAPNGFANALEIAAFLAACPPAAAQRPDARARSTRSTSSGCTATSSTPRPGLEAADIPKYFKDASFGVKQGDVERTYSPARRRDDRARQGLRRPAHLRHHPRRRDVRRRLRGRRGPAVRRWTCCATSAAGSSPRSPAAPRATASMDHEQWELAPYTEADLQRQFDLVDDVYGAEGARDPGGRDRTTWPASTPTSPRRARTR